MPSPLSYDYIYSEVYDWHKMTTQTIDVWETLTAVFGRDLHESPMGKTFWHLHHQSTLLVATRIRDDLQWLEWFQHENNMGRRAFCARAPKWKTSRPIRTIKQLARIIHACQPKS